MSVDPFDAIPRGRYGVILADPPWRFKTWSETNQTRAASQHYSLMQLDEIKALPVADLARENSVLLLWAINPMLPHAFDTIASWGFEFRTVAFTWAKRTPSDEAWHMGLGYWTRQNTEQCLLATRGKPKRLSRSVRQLVVSPRQAHSRKPDRVREDVEALLPGPYLEMFARTRRSGWDSFGDELGGFVSSAGRMDRLTAAVDVYADAF